MKIHISSLSIVLTDVETLVDRLQQEVTTSSGTNYIGGVAMEIA